MAAKAEENPGEMCRFVLGTSGNSVKLEIVQSGSQQLFKRHARWAAAKRDDRGKPEIYGTQYKCVFVRSRWQENQEKPTASLAIVAKY